MKKITTVLFCSVCITVSCMAQDKNTEQANGIYLTANDYTQHHLINAFGNDNKTTHWKLTWSSEIWIVYPDSTYKFSFSRIWGYRINGSDWRVYNNIPYKIDYTGKADVYVRPAKEHVNDDFPDSTDTKALYFSRDLSSQVRYLDRENLEKIFQSDSGFVQKIRSMPLLSSVTKWNKQQHCYNFITWLN